MKDKVKINPNIANPDLAKDARNSRLHEVADLLIVAILRLHLRERNKLIKKITGCRLYDTSWN